VLFFVGLIIVFVSVIGGFSVHGNLSILWQPVEFIIILGAGIGAYIIANPLHVVVDSIKSFKNLFKKVPFSKNAYLELLKFLFIFLKLIRVKGVLEIEKHVDNPKSSDIFAKYPTILNDHHVLEFICDNFRLLTLGLENQYILSDAMDLELEKHHGARNQAASALAVFGESLPALGIVAAVLGVIVTMGSISEPPAILGKLIGAALVGTFVGILLSYGIFSPAASYIKAFYDAEAEFYECIKVGIISHLQGNAPAITVEMVRKNIPVNLRPTFMEMEESLND
jgi:chemotaxis protein MotA